MLGPWPNPWMPHFHIPGDASGTRPAREGWSPVPSSREDLSCLVLAEGSCLLILTVVGLAAGIGVGEKRGGPSLLSRASASPQARQAGG